MAGFSYNQKAILFKTVRRYVQQQRARSLLDIGAGNGELATRLAKIVPVYNTIESNGLSVKKLKGLGIAVRKGIFPVKLHGEFDIVLASHSIPEQKKLYKKFLTEAWKKVRKDGLLLVITFKGSNDGINALRKALGLPTNTNDQILYRHAIGILKRLGRVKIEEAVSVMRAGNLQTMAEVLSPLVLSRRSETRSKTNQTNLENILRTRFKALREYRFPTPHMVISVRKK